MPPDNDQSIQILFPFVIEHVDVYILRWIQE